MMNATRKPTANPSSRQASIDEAQRHERNGEPRVALTLLAPLLAAIERNELAPRFAVQALFIASDCALSLSEYATGMRHIERIEKIGTDGEDALVQALALVHRARICDDQGHYSLARAQARQAEKLALQHGDWIIAARACRVQSYTACGQEDYEASAQYIRDGLAYAERSGDKFIEARLLNAAGIHYTSLALAKVLPPKMHGHNTAMEPEDFGPVQDEIAQADLFYERAARAAAECGVADIARSIEAGRFRIRIMRGEAAQVLTPLRRILRQCQDGGLRNLELPFRRIYAWALRACGHHAEAVQHIDAALKIANRFGRVNRQVELLHYDRSLVLAIMGDSVGALSSYRRYLGARARVVSAAMILPTASPMPTVEHPALEPFYMKKADKILAAHTGDLIELTSLARHCGVSPRCLQLGFKKFRGVTPMAYARNLRLDAVHRELQSGAPVVAAVAKQFGFRSVTTFSTEYRRRFGVSPRATVAAGRKQL